MDTKKTVIAMTERAIAGFFAHVDKMPADKVEWKPLDQGRSALNQAQECALCPMWAVDLLNDRKPPEWTEELMAEFGRQMAALDSIDKCKAAAQANMEKYKAAVEAFPDADWAETLQLPWDEKPFTYMAIAMIPYWNLTYHTGQVCYIQTLYGDHSF